jgi:hypothetical protein
MASASVLGFIGREAILSGLEERVLRKKQHVAVNGLPQIGKTQILMALGRRLEALPDGPRVVQTYLDGRPFQDAMHLFMSDLTDCFQEAEAADLEAAEAKGSDSELLDHLRTILLRMTAGRDLVWLLDEFELLFGGENPWTEEQYGAFIRKILLDGDLSGRLVLVVASRPAVSNMLTRFEQRLNPFVSETVLSFDLRDMAEYYDRLEKNICGRELDRAERMLIRRHCGRYPKLLSLLAMHLKLTGGDLTAALQKCQGTFNSQFEDTVRLMAREEKTAMHSFSSIVRCYFNPTADDGETVNRFYALGYVEKYLLPGDPLPQGDYPYPYMTVAPVFTDYLFKNHLDERQFGDITVPGISDPRMLLGGLVGTLRRITKDVLSRQYTGRDWNTEVLLGKCAWDAGGNRYYEYEFYQEGSRTKIRLKNYYLVSGSAGRIVFSSPVPFLSKAYDSSPRSDTWLLDPINLNDHANLIIGFASRFAPYFQAALNAGLQNSSAQTALRNIFAKLKEARDGYAHYLFSGQVASGTPSLQDQQTAALCKKLLRSIYSHIYAL